MLDLDPPDHTRLRALVHRRSRPAWSKVRGRIEALTELLGGRAPGEHGPDPRLRPAPPATIIAEMLGVPAADRHRFHRWSNAIMSAASSTWGLVKAVPNARPSCATSARSSGSGGPTRGRPGQRLVQAEEAGDKLSEAELLSMVLLLLVAGHETTVNLIGNGTLALLEHPDQMERLRDDPTLIKPAVEELLRYASPVETATERYAREDVTVAGVTIPRGEMVYAVLASANRDERQFPDPDALDITREPNKHLAFGLGTHFCLGAPLARLEGQIAIGTLLRRMPNLRITDKLCAGSADWCCGGWKPCR